MGIIPLVACLFMGALFNGAVVLAVWLYKRSRLGVLSVIVGVPVAFIMLAGLESLSIPLLAAALVLVPAALTLALLRLNKALFGKVWLAIAVALALFLLGWNGVLLPYLNREVISDIWTWWPLGQTGRLPPIPSFGMTRQIT